MLVISIIAFYTERMLEIDVDDTFRGRDFEDNYLYWNNTYPWWNQFILQSDFYGFAKFATIGSDYKNCVSTAFFITYRVFLPELHKFVVQAESILIEIENQLQS